MTDLIGALRVQLTADEGLRLFPYKDSVGKITIGVGRNLTDRGISKDEADYLLTNDIDLAIADCATFPWFSTTDAVRQTAIVDLRFNLGGRGLRRLTTFLTCMAAKDYSAAADRLSVTDWFRQVGQRGPRLVSMLRNGTV